MKSFDVRAQKYSIDALYSGDTTGVAGTSQYYSNVINPSYGLLQFNYDSAISDVTGNRPLVVNGVSSIKIGSPAQTPLQNSAYIYTPGPTTFGNWADGHSISVTIDFIANAGQDGVLLGQIAGANMPINTGAAGWVAAVSITSDGILNSTLFWHGGVGYQNHSKVSVQDGQRHRVVVSYSAGIETMTLDGIVQSTLTVGQVPYANDYTYYAGTGQGIGWGNFASLNASNWAPFAGQMAIYPTGPAGTAYYGYGIGTTNKMGLSCILDVIVPGTWLFYFVSSSGKLCGLYWNRKDQYTFYNIESDVQTTYVQSTASGTKYVSFQYDGTNTVITINNQVYRYTTDLITLSTLYGGQGGGSILVDKLAISASTNVLPMSLYSTLFKYNSLTNIYRPGNNSHFTYLFDSTVNKTIVLDGSAFGMLDVNRTASYPVVDSNNTYGLFSNAQFTAQISTGASFVDYPPQEFSRLANTDPIIIQHTDTTDVPYKFIIVETGPVSPALLGADVTVAGPVYGAQLPTRGYYSENGFDTSSAVFTIAAQTGVTIKSVEIMGQSSNLSTANITVNGAAPVGVLYTNGVIGNPKANQFNHCVFVFTTAVSQLEIANAPMLTGFGIGELAYTATDVKRIFDTYAGNTVQPPAEIVAKPVDGTLTNGPLTILNIKWLS